MNNSNINQELKNKLVKLYVDGASSEKLALENNIDPGVIRREVVKQGFKVREASECHRIYNLKKNYFDEIDNNEKAYFLGFMYADGTCRKNSENSAQCSLKINSNDEYILKKYADIIYDKDEYPIRRYPNGENRVETSVLTFYGVEFFKNLEKLGCTENKTFTLKFPNENQVPKKFISHFIRGYFDGDGCVSLRKDGRATIDFTSNDLFLKGLIEVLDSEGFKDLKLINHSTEVSTANFQFSKKEYIFNFFKYIYVNSNNFFLERKFNTFIKYLIFHGFIRKQDAFNLIKH